MAELELAAQDIVDYFDKMAKKYGRVTELLQAKPKVERLRKALKSSDDGRWEELKKWVDEGRAIDYSIGLFETSRVYKKVLGKMKRLDGEKG